MTKVSPTEGSERLTDLTVVSINHSRSNLADFFREMGDIFGLERRPNILPFIA